MLNGVKRVQVVQHVPLLSGDIIYIDSIHSIDVESAAKV